MLAVLMLTATLPALVSCGSKPPKDTYTRLTVDINPGVEFMIDDENKVMAVTAMNDDASILLSGEVLVGKTPEEATKTLVTLAANTGFLSDADGNPKTVKISLSGESRYAKKLYESVEKQANGVLEDLGVTSRVEKVMSLDTEALRALAAKTSLYSSEELEEMNEKQLYHVLAAGRVETALLVTEELREAYYNAKRHEIAFAERQAVANIIDGMGGLYNVVHAAYNTALTAYSKAIQALDEFRYNTFVAASSAYQQKLAELRAAKVDMLQERMNLSELDPNSEEYAETEKRLSFKESVYNAALTAFETVGTAANTALEALVAALSKCESALVELEEKFSDNIKDELKKNVKQLEDTLNAKKDAFFANFEAAHAADIQATEEALKAQKARLVAVIEKG